MFESSKISSDVLGVRGLCYCADLLSTEEQKAVLDEIDGRTWLGDLKRRVQHYGYKYDYKARKVDPSMFVGPLPAFAVVIATKLLDHGMIEEMPRSAHRQRIRARSGHFGSH